MPIGIIEPGAARDRAIECIVQHSCRERGGSVYMARLLTLRAQLGCLNRCLDAARCMAPPGVQRVRHSEVAKRQPCRMAAVRRIDLLPSWRANQSPLTFCGGADGPTVADECVLSDASAHAQMCHGYLVINPHLEVGCFRTLGANSCPERYSFLLIFR